MTLAAPPGAGVGARPRVDPDSRARTHLANERTFLAWLRTGLSLVAVGMAAARFLPLGLVPNVPYVTLFAILLVISGTMAVAYGANRYVVAAKEIESGNYAPSVLPIVAVAAIVTVLAIMTIPLVFLLR